MKFHKYTMFRAKRQSDKYNYCNFSLCLGVYLFVVVRYMNRRSIFRNYVPSYIALINTTVAVVFLEVLILMVGWLICVLLYILLNSTLKIWFVFYYYVVLMCNFTFNLLLVGIHFIFYVILAQRKYE